VDLDPNLFITRGDDGRREVNYSEIFGDLASGAIANAYYPSQDRGAAVVARSALIGAGRTYGARRRPGVPVA